MKFNVITLDTNIFHRENYNLENGILVTLEQFSRISNIDFVLSEIVLREIKAHMKENTQKFTSEYIKSLKEGLFYQIDDTITKDKIKEIKDKDIVEIIKNRFVRYAEKTKLNIIPADNVDLQAIIKDYFNENPPFSEKKKEEFPDAIALQSLENWAIHNNKTILVVSNDKDWQQYCETSSVMHCVKTIEEALSSLYKNEEFLLKRLKDIFSNCEQYEAIINRIDELVMNSSDKISITLAIISAYTYDEEYFDTDFAYTHFPSCENLEIIDLDKDNNIVTISIPSELTFYIDGAYSFYIKDGDEYIEIGGNKLEEEKEFNTNLIITLKLNEQSLDKSQVLAVDFKDYSFKTSVVLEPDYSKDYQGDEYIEKEPEDIR